MFGTILNRLDWHQASVVAEYCDPAYVRQSLAFHLFRKTGNLVPFHYPVRVNLNGEFYQLAFHSARFSDELIEDQYGLDPRGYGYKNSGCLTPNLTNWVSCEKKTPDDGDETSSAAKAPLKAWTTAFGSSLRNDADDQAVVTREVVRTFNLPAWINYLAAARITMECDDNWANLSTYWDKYGTGTWMPLGYDMNQSWGHIYYTQWNGTKNGLYAELDQHKAHPLFGGRRIISHVSNGNPSAQKDGGYGENYAMEAVWQSTKFRRLYLRRLRTLMDTELGAPGTPKEETPVWQYVVAVTNATWECAQLDYAKWRAHESDLPAGSSGTFWTKTGTYAWSGKVEHAQGVDDLWTQYIVPRRRHLYETHSIHNTAKGVGYGQNLSAGIPDAQFASTILLAGFELVSLTTDDLMIFNGNAEAVDLSGWRLGGAVDWTFPAGTVVDAGDTITVVRDRAAWIVAHDADLEARVVVGNATFTGATGLTLTPAGAPADDPGFAFETSRTKPNGFSPWFDAEAQDFAPGADMTTLEETKMNGAFSAVGGARGVVASTRGINRFDISGAMLEGDRIVFTPTEAQQAKKRVIIEMTVAIPDALPELPERPDGFAALTLAKSSDGQVTFAAYDGADWHCVGNAGVPAATEVAYRVRLTLDYRRAKPTITYAVKTGTGWLDLADAHGVVSFPVAKPIDRIDFAGCGELAGVSGDYYTAPGITIRIQ